MMDCSGRIISLRSEVQDVDNNFAAILEDLSGTVSIMCKVGEDYGRQKPSKVPFLNELSCIIKESTTVCSL